MRIKIISWYDQNKKGLIKGMGNSGIVLQAFNEKATTATNRYNQALMDALDTAAQPGVDRQLLFQTVQGRSHEMVRATVNQALHQNKHDRQHIAVSFHKGQVSEV